MRWFDPRTYYHLIADIKKLAWDMPNDWYWLSHPDYDDEFISAPLDSQFSLIENHASFNEEEYLYRDRQASLWFMGMELEEHVIDNDKFLDWLFGGEADDVLPAPTEVTVVYIQN